MKKILLSCLHNLIYTYILNQQYDLAMENIHEYNAIDSSRDRIKLYEAICNYKLGNISECKNNIYTFKYFHTNPYIEKFLRLIDEFITNNQNKINEILSI